MNAVRGEPGSTLRACGWQIVPFDQRKPLSAYEHHAIEEYPTANGPADYAPLGRGRGEEGHPAPGNCRGVRVHQCIPLGGLGGNTTPVSVFPRHTCCSACIPRRSRGVLGCRQGVRDRSLQVRTFSRPSTRQSMTPTRITGCTILIPEAAMETVPVELDQDLVALLEELQRPAKEAARELIVLELYRQGDVRVEGPRSCLECRATSSSVRLRARHSVSAAEQ